MSRPSPRIRKANRAYWGRDNTFVWPAAARVAVSLVIVTTFQSPSRSPTNNILPSIIAAGFDGLKTIPCSFSCAGFTAASGAVLPGAPETEDDAAAGANAG